MIWTRFPAAAAAVALVMALVVSRSALHLGWDLLPFLVAVALTSRSVRSRPQSYREDWVWTMGLAFALAVFLAFGAVEAALIVAAGGLVAAVIDRYATGAQRRILHSFRTARSVIGILAGGLAAAIVTGDGLSGPGDASLAGYLPFLAAYLVVQAIVVGVVARRGAQVRDGRPLVRPDRIAQSPVPRALVWEVISLLVAASLALIIDTLGLRLDYWIACVIAFVLLFGINRLLELNGLLRDRNNELAQAMSELRTLNAVGHVLNATIDLDRICIELAAQLRRVTRADAIVIALIDPARTRVRIAYYAYGGVRQPERFEEMPEPVVGPPAGPAGDQSADEHDRVPGDGIVSRVLATRRPVLGSDTETFGLVRPDGSALPVERSGVRHFHSAIGIPLQVAGELIGAIAVKSHQPGVFDRSHIDLLSQVGNQAAMAMRNAEIIASERASNRARQDFLTVVSHELRTPITSIFGYSQLLSRRLSREMVPPGVDQGQPVARPRTSSSHLEMVEIISEQSRHLGRLVDDLVTLSGLGQGNMRFEMQPLNLAEVVTEAVEGYRKSMDEPDRLRMEVASEPRVVGDRRRIREVLNNLIGNAITHGPTETPIEVWVGERTDAAEIRVSDQGKGIPMNAQAHVFEPFFRGGDETDDLQRGLGLGLSISREIVIAHGGTISVLSDEGAGATFIVRIQLAETTDIEQTAPVSIDPQSPSAHSQGREEDVPEPASLDGGSPCR